VLSSWRIGVSQRSARRACAARESREFRAAWLAYCQTDPLLAAYVQATEQAVVVWGNEQGETLGQADLKA